MSNIKSNEPTIDEMLEFMNHMSFLRGNNAEIAKAIRAILVKVGDLEQVRESAVPLVQRIERDAIRAFVERVKARMENQWDDYWYEAILDELAAMEKENEQANAENDR